MSPISTAPLEAAGFLRFRASRGPAELSQVRIFFRGLDHFPVSVYLFFAETKFIDLHVSRTRIRILAQLYLVPKMQVQVAAAGTAGKC